MFVGDLNVIRRIVVSSVIFLRGDYFWESSEGVKYKFFLMCIIVIFSRNLMYIGILYLCVKLGYMDLDNYEWDFKIRNSLGCI